MLPIAKTAGALLLAVVALVSFYYGVLRPSLSVELASNQIDPLDPFTANLVIENRGYFRLYNLVVICFPGLDVAMPKTATIADTEGQFRIATFKVAALEP